MHDKTKDDDNFIRIPMHTSTIISVIILPIIILVMLYFILFTECSYLLKNGLYGNDDCNDTGTCNNKLADHPDVANDTVVIDYDSIESTSTSTEDGTNVSEIQGCGGPITPEVETPKKAEETPIIYKLFFIVLNPFQYMFGQPGKNKDETIGKLEMPQEKEPKLTRDQPIPVYEFPADSKKVDKSTQTDVQELGNDEDFPLWRMIDDGRNKDEIPRVIEKHIPDAKPSRSLEEKVLKDTPLPKELENPKNDVILLPYAKRYMLGPNAKDVQVKSDEDTSVGFYKELESDEVNMLYDFWEFSVPNTIVCPDNGKDLYLLIAIHTHVRNFEARRAIRETWGRTAKLDGVNYVFILGFDVGVHLDNQIKHESDTYKDIIWTDLNDFELNDTAKTVMFMKWLKFYCFEVKYVFKTQDDVFVNVPQLSRFIQTENIKENAMYGFLYKDYLAERDMSKPNYVSRNQYRYDIFPDFLSSEGYLFPAKLAPLIYQKALKAPYINIENVFITGILAEQLHIERIDVPLFSLTYPDLPKTEKCSIFAYGIVFHPVSPFGLRWFWNDLKKTGFNCGMFLEFAAAIVPKSRLMYTSSFYQSKILYPLLAGEPILGITGKEEDQKNDKNVTEETPLKISGEVIDDVNKAKTETENKIGTTAKSSTEGLKIDDPQVKPKIEDTNATTETSSKDSSHIDDSQANSETEDANLTTDKSSKVSSQDDVELSDEAHKKDRKIKSAETTGNTEKHSVVKKQGAMSGKINEKYKTI